MSTYAIISEFNPFHNGHKYLFDRAREMGARRIVCIMSGNAVQRGQIAIINKYARAEMALECGADLVLELPFPYCAASAEHFAACGVRIASAFADKLIFGSECGDIRLMRRAAEIGSGKEFVEKYKNTLKDNSGAAESYFKLLCEELGDIKLSSNDILGIEYIKAIIKQDSSLSPVTVRREGADYSEIDILDGSFQSASALRELIYAGKLEGLGEFMPQHCVKILRREAERGEITDRGALATAFKMYFGVSEPEELLDLAEVDMGIASRLCKMSGEFPQGELLEAVRTKRYTDSRLRRAMLFAVCKVTEADVRSTPAYVNLLGANKAGRELLSANKKSGNIEVIAKQVDIPDTKEAKRQFSLSQKCDLLFALSCLSPRATSELLTKSPIIK